MVYSAAVNVLTIDLPLRVVAFGEDAQAGAYARARSVNGDKAAPACAQEPVSRAARVIVGSCSLSRRVDAVRDRAQTGGRARVGSLERREAAVGMAHEAVIRVARVNVESGDCPVRVEAGKELRKGPLTGGRARIRHIEHREPSFMRAQEAVTDRGRVNVVSGDRTGRVDISEDRALACARARAFHFKRID